MHAYPLTMHRGLTFCEIKALYSPKCVPGPSPCLSDPAAHRAPPSLHALGLQTSPACGVSPALLGTVQGSPVYAKPHGMLRRSKLCTIASQPYGQAYQEAYQTGNLDTLSVDEAQDRSAWHFTHGRPASADEVPPSVVLARQAAKVGWRLCGQAEERVAWLSARSPAWRPH